MAIESRNILKPGRVACMPTPAVSVVVPNFNYARYLPQRIESVLNQTFTDFEVILLDDASTDNSVEVMRRYAETDSRISRIEVNATNSGSPFLQWERGVKLARGRYIWIAEADDFADPAFLASCMRALECNRNVVVAFTMSEMWLGDNALIPNSLEKDADPDGSTSVYCGRSYLVSKMHNTNAIYNASMAVFKKAAVNGFKLNIYRNMRYIGDWAFWCEMMLHGNVAHIHKRSNRFRQHGASTTHKSKQNESRKLLRDEETLFDCTFGPIFRSIRYQLLTGLSRPETVRLNFARKHLIIPLFQFIRKFSENKLVYEGKQPMLLERIPADLHSN